MKSGACFVFDLPGLAVSLGLIHCALTAPKLNARARVQAPGHCAPRSSPVSRGKDGRGGLRSLGARPGALSEGFKGGRYGSDVVCRVCQRLDRSDRVEPTYGRAHARARVGGVRESCGTQRSFRVVARDFLGPVDGVQDARHKGALGIVVDGCWGVGGTGPDPLAQVCRSPTGADCERRSFRSLYGGGATLLLPISTLARIGNGECRAIAWFALGRPEYIILPQSHSSDSALLR